MTFDALAVAKQIAALHRQKEQVKKSLIGDEMKKKLIAQLDAQEVEIGKKLESALSGNETAGSAAEKPRKA